MGTTIGTLIRLAVEVEKEGQYNVAKLLRAAARSLAAASGAETGGPTDPRTQAEALEAVADDLATTARGPLSGPLRAAAALRAARVPMVDETPPPPG